MSYSNILCGDPVLWEKHFPGISEIGDVPSCQLNADTDMEPSLPHRPGFRSFPEPQEQFLVVGASKSHVFLCGRLLLLGREPGLQ